MTKKIRNKDAEKFKQKNRINRRKSLNSNKKRKELSQELKEAYKKNLKKKKVVTYAYDPKEVQQVFKKVMKKRAKRK